MLKRLKAWVKNLYAKIRPSKSEWASFKGQGLFGIPLERQILKRTHLKPGDQYKLGEGIVTVHENKAAMLAAIAAVEAKREAKHAALRERGIDIMMMSPEELKRLGIEEWLATRSKKESKLRSIVGKFTPNYLLKKAIPYEKAPPIGKTERIQSHVLEKIKDKEKA